MRRIVLSVLLLLGSALSPLTALADMSKWPCGGQRIELSTTDPDELRAYMFRCSDPSLTAQTVSTDNECGGRRIELSNTDPNELKAFMFRCSAPSVTASRVVPDPSCGGRRIELSHTDPKELRALMFRCSAGLPQGPEVLAVRVNDGPVQEVEEDDTDDSGDTDADSGGNGDGGNTGGGSTGGCLNCVDGQPDTSRGPFDEFRSFRHCTPRPEPKVEQQHHIMEDGRLATGGSIRTFDGASHNRYGNFFAMTFDTDSGERHSTVQLDLSSTIRSSEYETLVWKVFVNDTSLEEDFAVCLADSRGDCSRDAELRRHADRRNSPAWQMVYIPVDDFRESRIGAVNFTREGTGPAVVMRDLYLTNLTIAEINGETPDYDEACDAIYASPERDPNRIRQAVEPWGEGTVRVGVKDLGGYTLNVWSYPSREDGRIRASYAYGETGTIVGGPYEYAGYVWWKVEWESGVTGWSVQEKLGLAYRVLGYGVGGSRDDVTTYPDTSDWTVRYTGAYPSDLSVRSEPSTAGGADTVIARYGTECHETGQVLRDPMQQNGLWWWQIQWYDGTVGWSADNDGVHDLLEIDDGTCGSDDGEQHPHDGSITVTMPKPITLEPIRALVFRVKGVSNASAADAFVFLKSDGVWSDSQVVMAEHMITGTYDANIWYTVVVPIDAFFGGSVDDAFAVTELVLSGAVDATTVTDVALVEGLEFPLRNGWTPWLSRITSVFDHSMTRPYSEVAGGLPDGEVVAWSGEIAIGNPVNQGAYPKLGGGVFSVHGTYYNNQTSSDESNRARLNYDNHPGVDYANGDSLRGEPVFAAGNGAVLPSGCWTYNAGGTCVFWGAVGVDHGNGYITQYWHMSNVQVVPGQTVSTETVLGYVSDVGTPGQPHLHFEVAVRAGDTHVHVDPYGWSGLNDDPYIRAQNVCLWKSGCP